MIPILYDGTETQFASNGIGRLADATDCKVTEKRNGEYELTLTYPITGKYYSQIKEGMIISATHDDHGDRQPFRIYHRSAPMGGLVTFDAHHITYDLNHIVVDPITATSAGDAFGQIERLTTPLVPYSFWTDVTTGGTFTLSTPATARSALGGVRGSILDVFGGEYEWTADKVYLRNERGRRTDITIRYGKNLTDLTQTVDVLDTYNAIVPFWFDEETGTLVTLPEKYVAKADITTPVLAVMDFSAEWEKAPSVEALRAKATSYLSNNRPWVPSENIKISFVQLWQTEEYKDVAALQRLGLCDRVNVYYPALGITAEHVEIIKVVYNVLLDRYDEMELGDARSTFGETLIKPMEEAIEAATQKLPTKSFLQREIDRATSIITGGGGGNVLFVYDSNGKFTDIMIMDTADQATAQQVLRINMDGIGFSSTGVNGPFYSAWTLDGHFVSNAVTAGMMTANMVRGGTFELGGANNGSGVLVVLDANGNEIGRWDNTGAEITGNITLQNNGVDADINQVDGFFFNVSQSVRRVRKVQAYALRVAGDSWGTHSADRYRSNAYGFITNDMQQMYKETVKTALELFIAYQADRAIITKYGTGKYSFWNEYAGQDGYILANTLADTTNDISGYAEHGFSEGKGQILLILQNIIAICSRGFAKGQSSGSTGYIGTDQGLQADYTSSYFYISPDYGGIAINCGDGTSESVAEIDVKGTLQMRHDSLLRVYENAQVNLSNIISASYSNISVNNGTATKYVQFQSTSSRRYKHDIELLKDAELDPRRLLDLPVRQFIYNDDAVLQYDDMADKTLPGFIAEEVAVVYPSAVIRNPEGGIESWDERRIIPGMLALIQEQQNTIDTLQARIEKLEGLVNKLMGE